MKIGPRTGGRADVCPEKAWYFRKPETSKPLTEAAMAVTKQQALDYHLGQRPGKIEVVPSKACHTQRD
jgi:hypothetical protein